jgi:peptide/nickel transport system substrate-binding protein
VVITAPGEAEHLFPPLVATLAAKQIVDQVYDFLADVGPELQTIGDAGFVPRLATRWTWSVDSSSVDFHLDPAARWHDGRSVRAADVTFTLDLYRDPVVASPRASSLPAIDSAVAVDSATVRFHFGDRNPERFYRLVYNLLILPQHALAGVERGKLAESAFTRQPIGSGPFRVVNWTQGVSIELVANEQYHRGRPALDRLIWRTVTDASAGAQSVAAGESDVIEVLRPEGMTLAASNAEVRAFEYPSFQTGALLFNTRNTSNRRAPHPILGDRSVRRALAMAIDRQTVVSNALDSLARVSYGPFPMVYWSSDTTVTQLRNDLQAAAATLDSAGWRDTNGDSIRDKAGAPLRIDLLVPSVSNTRRQMAVVIQEQLRKVGVEVVVDVMEPAALFPRLTQGKFDAFIHLWQNDPSPSSIIEAFGGRDLERSSNYGWYVSATVDSLALSAAREIDMGRARALYREMYETINADAPAVFLWEPRNFALLHARIEPSAMRGDAWWAGLSRWRVLAGQKIGRDQIASAK